MNVEASISRGLKVAQVASRFQSSQKLRFAFDNARAANHLEMPTMRRRAFPQRKGSKRIPEI
jgi:hypothetical protein